MLTVYAFDRLGSPDQRVPSPAAGRDPEAANRRPDAPATLSMAASLMSLSWPACRRCG